MYSPKVKESLCQRSFWLWIDDLTTTVFIHCLKRTWLNMLGAFFPCKDEDDILHLKFYLCVCVCECLRVCESERSVQTSFTRWSLRLQLCLFILFILSVQNCSYFPIFIFMNDFVWKSKKKIKSLLFIYLRRRRKILEKCFFIFVSQMIQHFYFIGEKP